MITYRDEKCKYLPCHSTDDIDDFSCIFCYCPLYKLGDGCGGDFIYLDGGIKDCSGCLKPHTAAGCREIMERLSGD